MFKKIALHAWFPVAVFGVCALWLFSACWNFGHAYVLAGGDNPMVLLEGKWPSWNGPAIAVALAAVAADIVKATGGFILIAAFTNKALKIPARIGAVLLALVLVIPTFAWSARSAMGMVALVFGDTIATRGNEQMVSRSLREQIDMDQQRFAWLAQQKSSVRAVERANRVEAAELRRELEKNRKELRQAKGIGGADPGGSLLAKLTGISPDTISNWTVLLFIAMVEIASTLGFPALALATRVARSSHNDPRQPPIIIKAAKAHKDDDDKDDKDNPLGGNDKKGAINGALNHEKTTVNYAALSAENEPEVIYGNDDDDMEADAQDARARHKSRSGRRGRPRKARISDGHIEHFVDWCRMTRRVADRKAYLQFCRDQYLEPMVSTKMWTAMKGRGRLGREHINKFFETGRLTPLRIALN